MAMKYIDCALVKVTFKCTIVRRYKPFPNDKFETLPN